GGIETHSRVSYSSTWLSIVNEVNKMRNKGIDLLKYMKIHVGNGQNTMFWEDVWIGNKNFKTSFPRIYALEFDKNLIVADKMAHNDTAFSLRRQLRDGVEMEQFRALSIVIEGVLLHDMVDRWKWTLEGSGEFSVAPARKFIDNSWLIGSPKKTRWIKMVPIKVNILAWKVQFDLLPTRLNLSHRENQKNWKWEDVIVIDDVDVLNEVAETDNNAEVKEEHVTLDVPNQHKCVFNSEEDEDEAENQNPWVFDDEFADEDDYNDEVVDEDEFDDKDEWP
nr:hypothetical protein [Tanacetum cinerariifolium]